jgi:16S rRNA (cytosine967-C5)-methyltransferase
VLVDAPCTGSGTWRRRPDTKWRLTPDMLAERNRQQDAVLQAAQRFVRPGGELVYVTCSLLPQENAERIAAFRAAHSEFAQVPLAGRWQSIFGAALPAHADPHTGSITLTPATTGTDGFFIASLRRSG